MNLAGSPGTEYLDSLAVDLKPDRAGGDVAEDGADMEVESSALAGWQVDLLYIGQPVFQRAQQIFSRDRHAEY